MSRDDYIKLLDSVEKSINDLRKVKRHRRFKADLDKAVEYINEMKVVGRHNRTFRQETSAELEALLDWMYLEING